ncbi:MAG: FTR1 family protein [Gemmatimonadaceae bacterium]|nr:FTR1 family protein [Gemmatimonadaceae bacterium]
MSLRTILIYAFGAFALLARPSVAAAQESPARRLGNIVGVAADEYSKGVDSAGRIVLQVEYDEAVAFLDDAKSVAARVSDERAPKLVALIERMQAQVTARVAPADLLATQVELVTLLGPDASLDFPTKAVDLAEGRAIYAQRCASCHGDAGGGDGPAARRLNPAPPALGDRELMFDVSPATMYRVVSVGIRGTSMAGAGDLTPAQRWAVVTYVNTLRASAEEVRRGAAVLAERCVTCGDGAVPAGHTFGWLAERHDQQLLTALAAGEVELGLDAHHPIDGDEARAVVAALRANPRVVELPTRTPRVVAAEVLAILDRAISTANEGNASAAGDLAFDAYVAFEPLEAKVRTQDPGLVAMLERHFADFKGAVVRGDVVGAGTARARISGGLPQIVERAERAPSGWGAFLESLLIILREGFEAILIVGAIIAFLVRTDNRSRVREVWAGVGVGVLASAVLAVVLRTALANAPASREVIEGATMLVAVAVLFSVSYWLLTKVEVAAWQRFIREKVGTALSAGGATALASAAFLAVFREGAETALFYQALLSRGPQVIPPMLGGLALGSLLLVALWVGIQRFGLRIPLRAFFGTTSALLYTLAFIFMGKGLRELQEGNLLGITPIEGGPYLGALGIFPSVETLVGQGLMLLLAIVALVLTLRSRPATTAAAAPQASTDSPAPRAAEAEAGL